MPASTSTQRTYRYVRLGILGAVLVLTITLVAVVSTEGPLASISAVHYTSGSALFTGSLVAIAFAFLALAGRSPAQALLDLAALAAPLIAIVPTPIQTGDVPGLLVICDLPCVPQGEIAAMDTGLVVFVVVSAVVIVAAVVLGIVQQTLTRGLVATIVVAALATAGVGLWRATSPESFLLGAHVVAASTFFALVAAVSALAARRSGIRYRGVYLTVAVLIAVDLVALVAIVLLRFVDIDLARSTGVPLVFIGETIAVALFAVFWTVQTVQNWSDVDPAVRVA